MTERKARARTTADSRDGIALGLGSWRGVGLGGGDRGNAVGCCFGCGHSGSVIFVFLSDVRIELLEQAADGALVGDAEGSPKGGLDAAIALGIVEVGDSSTDEIAGQVRISGLPLAFVVVGAEGRGDGIQGAMEDRSMAQAEVAGILVENHRQDSIAEEVAAEVIRIVGAVALGVAFEALAVTGVFVFGLADASVDAGEYELVGVKRTLEEEMELLARAERGCLAVVNGVEVWNHSGHALFRFQLEFGGGAGFDLLRSFLLGSCLLGSFCLGRRGCLLPGSWGGLVGLLLVRRLRGTEAVGGVGGGQLGGGSIRQDDRIVSCRDVLLRAEGSCESETCKECRNDKERRGLFRHDDEFTYLYFPIDGLLFDVGRKESDPGNVSRRARKRAEIQGDGRCSASLRESARSVWLKISSSRSLPSRWC